MKRTTLVSAVCALAGVLAFTSTAGAHQDDCHQYDVVGTTNITPVDPPTDPQTYNVELLPDGLVRYDPAAYNQNWWEDDVYGCYNAYQNPFYYSYFSACDFNSSGAVEAIEVLEIYNYLNQTPGSISCPVHIPGGTAAVESVGFGGNGYNTILSDNSSEYFSAPHWEYGMGEPVAYVRGSTPAMSVTIRAESADMLTGNIVMISGIGPDGLIIPATHADVWNDEASLSSVSFLGALPNTVDYYEPFTVTWRLSIDNGSSWIEAGTTENTLYVLYSWPMTTLYETTVDLGCRNAAEKSNPDDIVYAIWDDFTDLEVYTVDGTLLSYYPEGSNPQNMPTTPGAMLAAGYGNCVGYANFFIAIAEGLGVTGVQYTDIYPNSFAGQANYLLLAKNWNMEPYLNDPDAGVPRNEVEGIPGMGNPNPTSKLFVNHVLVRYNGQILDTSYGIEFNTLLDWQRTILEAVMFSCGIHSSGWCFEYNDPAYTDSWPLLVEYD